MSVCSGLGNGFTSHHNKYQGPCQIALLDPEFHNMEHAENVPRKEEIFVIIHQLSYYHIQGDVWEIQK